MGYHKNDAHLFYDYSESISKESYYDFDKHLLFFFNGKDEERQNIYDEVVNKRKIKKFYLEVISNIEKIQDKIKENINWLAATRQIRIPIDNGYRFKDPLTPDEKIKIEKLNDKYNDVIINYTKVLDDMVESYGDMIK